MRLRHLAIGAAVLAVLLGACGDDDADTSTVPSSTSSPSSTTSGGGATATSSGAVPSELGPLDGHAFLSTTITRELVDGTRIRLEFAENEVRAHAGCNHLRGTARVDGDQLVITNVGGTEMGCDPALHAQDEWLAAFLESGPGFTLDADTFMLFDGTDRIAMVDEASAEPDRQLEGILWVVSSLVDGDSVSSVPGSPQVEASMTFTGGQVQGTDGCNQFSGPAELGDGTVTFGALRMTRMACPGDRDALARAVAPVIQGTVTYSIDADQLVLTAENGRGLVLRARD